MLQEMNAQQQYAESGSSVALHQHPDGSLSEHRLADQEQADSFVAPLVLVLTPNGGEVLTVGQPVMILWKSASRIGLVAHKVQLSTDGGATYNQDISPRLDGTARSYTWTPAADTVTKDARVRVVAIDRIGNWGTDDSDGTFIIQMGDRQAPAVKVLYPNGGERLQPGQQVLIQWKNDDNVGVASHLVMLSLDGGITYQPISPTLPGTDQSFLWTVPAIFTLRGLIRVVAIDAAGNQGMDNSDGSFIIQAGDRQSPTVKVLYPNGGEVLQAGQQVEIQWKSNDNVGVVWQSVLLSTDGGNTYSDISGPLDGTPQSFLWTVPRLATFEALMRVVAVDRAGNQGMDDSDGKFTIQFPMKEAIKDKEVKEHWEGKDVWEKGGWEKDVWEFPSQPMQRLPRLEQSVGHLMHFIRLDSRPTLDMSALAAEPGLSSSGQAALSQLLQKQASAAKQAKDTKDVEKLRER